jgi:hypothetical protein
MPNNTDGKKGRIGGIRSATSTSGVKKTGAIATVEETKKASAVSGIRAAGAASSLRATRAISMAERAQLFELIHEEADKLLSGKNVPPQHKDIVEKAVKMTIDAAALLEEEEKKKG